MQHDTMGCPCHADASIPVEPWLASIEPMSGDADIAAIGAALAEPARAKILLALGDGRSLAASMLAMGAGVAASTASHHLARLVEAGLIVVEPRGRHRRYALAGPAVGELIEAVARVAPPQPVMSLRQGTRAHAVRYARRCYDHLAGRLGVAVADSIVELRGETFVVSRAGARRLAAIGVDAAAADLARPCLDWTEDRHHVAGVLGRDLLSRLVELGWVTRDAKTRAIRVTDAGRDGFPAAFGVPLPD
jgi:DNA-binding transcriptional ArsR family regulator